MLSADQFGDLQNVVHQSAQAYNKSRGMPPIRGDFSKVVQPHGVMHKLGQGYADAPRDTNDPHVNASYHALEDEIGRQFEHMAKPTSKGGLGVSGHVLPVDPYGRRDMSQPYADKPEHIITDTAHDVQENKRVAGLDTNVTGGSASFRHPDTNNMLRVVHDVMGHLGTGRGVDMHGEEAAYQHHRQMFTPEARPALAMELRMQNSYLHHSGNFPGLPKRGAGYDSGPISPSQFGEHYNTLRAEADAESKKQGL